MLSVMCLVPLLLAGCMSMGSHHGGEQTGHGSVDAARSFLQTLTPEQRDQATMPLEAPERTQWHYIPKATRKGLSLNEMTGPQQQAAVALMKNVLSDEGFDKARIIMELERILRAVEQRPQVRDPLKYYWTIFGTPDAEGRWALSIEGHHLSLNFTFADGHLAGVTPMFFGANPNVVRRDVGVGPPVGTYPLRDEEQLGFELVRSLSDNQRKQAIVADKSPFDMKEAERAQTAAGDPVGLAVSDMTDPQKQLVADTISAYIRKAPQNVAKPYLKRALQQLDETRFAWFGPTEPGIGHSYRLQGPDFLFLLFNTQKDVDGVRANHAHTLWRMIGQDFDVQHHHHHDHGQPHDH